MKYKQNLLIRGFTLIEMIIVMAILAVLLIITIPVVNNIFSRSTAARSAANLREISIGLHSYAIDNQGRFPAVRSTDEVVWFNAIAPYLDPGWDGTGSAAVFNVNGPNPLICPVWLEHVRSQTPPWGATNWNRIGYGMSFVMVGSPSQGGPHWARVDHPALLGEIVNPSNTIIVAEEHSWNFGLHAVNYAASPYFDSPLRGARHGPRAGANVLLVDGSVRQLNRDTIAPFLAR